MDPGQGGSGHRRCPSCDKYAPYFSGKVCDECWVWFEENVDDYYHKGGRRINGRLLCPFESSRTQKCPGYLFCPQCKLNIFLNVTGYENPNICRCRLCGSKTFLKGCMCSRCLRQQRAVGELEALEKFEEEVPPYISEQMSPSTSSKVVVRDSSEPMEDDDDDDDCIIEKEIIKVKPLPQPELPPLKYIFTGIPKEFQNKARDQVMKGCYVLLYRDMDALLKKKLPVENDPISPVPMAIEAAPELAPIITGTVPMEECIRVERNHLNRIEELKRIIASYDPPRAASLGEDRAFWSLDSTASPPRSNGPLAIESAPTPKSPVLSGPRLRLIPSPPPEVRRSKKRTRIPSSVSSSSEDSQQIPKKKKLEKLFGDIDDIDTEDSSSKPKASTSKSTDNKKKKVDEKKEKERSSSKEKDRLKSKEKKRKEEEAKKDKDRGKKPKEKSQKEEDPSRRLFTSNKNKGKDIKPSEKPAKDKLNYKIPKIIPSVGLPPLLTENLEQSKASTSNAKPVDPAPPPAPIEQSVPLKEAVVVPKPVTPVKETQPPVTNGNPTSILNLAGAIQSRKESTKTVGFAENLERVRVLSPPRPALPEDDEIPQDQNQGPTFQHWGRAATQRPPPLSRPPILQQSQESFNRPQQPQESFIRPRQPQESFIRPQQSQESYIRPQQPQESLIRPQQQNGTFKMPDPPAQLKSYVDDLSYVPAASSRPIVQGIRNFHPPVVKRIAPVEATKRVPIEAPRTASVEDSASPASSDRSRARCFSDRDDADTSDSESSSSSSEDDDGSSTTGTIISTTSTDVEPPQRPAERIEEPIEPIMSPMSPEAEQNSTPMSPAPPSTAAPEEEEDDVLDIFGNDEELDYEYDDPQKESGEVSEESSTASRTPHRAPTPTPPRIAPPPTPQQQQVVVQPSPRIIATPQQSPAAPDENAAPCRKVIRNGQCSMPNCKYRHSFDLTVAFEAVKKLLLSKDFQTVKDIVFDMASQGSPFKESLRNDKGQNLVQFTVDTLLKENKDNLTEMALSIIAYPAIPLQPAEVCEKVMIQAAPTPAVAAFFLTLYKRFDQERVTINKACWDKITRVMVHLKDWQQTYDAILAAYKRHSDYYPNQRVLEYLFSDALPDKRRLSMVAEMLQKLEPYHFPMDSRQPILTALHEFNLVRLATHYSKLFNLPLPERSLPLLPNHPVVAAPPLLPTPPAFTAPGLLPIPPAFTMPPPPNPAPMNDNNNNGNAVRTDMRYDLIRLTISPSRKPVSFAPMLNIPRPTGPLDQGILNGLLSSPGPIMERPPPMYPEDEVAATAPNRPVLEVAPTTATPNVLVEPSYGTEEQLDVYFQQQDFGNVAKILVDFYSGSRTCSILKQLMVLIKSRVLVDAADPEGGNLLPGTIAMKIMTCIMQHVGAVNSEEFRKVKPLLTDVAFCVLQHLYVKDAELERTAESEEDSDEVATNQSDAYDLITFLLSACEAQLVSCMDGNSQLLLFAADCCIKSSYNVSDDYFTASPERDLIEKRVECINDAFYFLKKFHKSMEQKIPEIEMVEKEQKIFQHILTVKNELQKCQEYDEQTLLPSWVEYQEASMINKAAFAAAVQN